MLVDTAAIVGLVRSERCKRNKQAYPDVYFSRRVTESRLSVIFNLFCLFGRWIDCFLLLFFFFNIVVLLFFTVVCILAYLSPLDSARFSFRRLEILGCLFFPSCRVKLICDTLNVDR